MQTYQMAQFERWAQEREMDLTRHLDPKFPEYDYYDILTQQFWECWQAAQELMIKKWLDDRFRFAGRGKLGLSFGDPMERLSNVLLKGKDNAEDTD